MKTALLGLACLWPALSHAAPFGFSLYVADDDASDAIYLATCSKGDEKLYAVAAHYPDTSKVDGATPPDYACQFPDADEWLHGVSSCPLRDKDGKTWKPLVVSPQRTGEDDELSGEAHLGESTSLFCFVYEHDLYESEKGVKCSTNFICTRRPKEDESGSMGVERYHSGSNDGAATAVSGRAGLGAEGQRDTVTVRISL